jgi:hypothetical protein
LTGSLVWVLVVLGGFAWTRVLGSASVQRLLDRSAQ